MAEAEEVSLEELVQACRDAQAHMPFITTDFREVTESENLPSEETEEESEELFNSEPVNPSSELEVSLPLYDEDIEAANLDRPPKRKQRGKSEWKNEKQKVKRMKKESYLGYTKSNPSEKKRILAASKDARNIGPTCTSTSCAKTKLRSCSKFPEAVRNTIFTEFWRTMDWGEKKACVRNLVDQTKKKYPRKGIDSNRCDSFIYYLKLNGVKHQVCRQMFLSTLGLKRKQLRNWLTTGETSQSTKRRGKSGPHEAENYANEFLQKLPKMPSHYCRSSSDKMYLQPDFQNMSQLYRFYKSECEANKKVAYKRTRFVELIEEMKISIYRPKKDECDVCCSHKQGNTTDEDWNQHVKKKEAARAEKQKDKKLAISGACHVIAMDVQAVLMAPKLNASALYYKTKLAVHNFSVYNLGNRHVKCYLWDESEGDLVASVFATCLINYLEKNFTDNLPIIIFSDGCTSQNRNAVMSSALLTYAMKTKKTIVQKYLEKGHTQFEVDSVHSTIERAMKGKCIYHPAEYEKVCIDARINPFPYEVGYMKHTDFKDFSKNQRYISIRPGNKTGDPCVTDLRQIKYQPDGCISYKMDHDGDWSEMPRKPKDVKLQLEPNLYRKRLSITKRKYNDLQDLLHVIPSNCHDFYNSLPN